MEKHKSVLIIVAALVVALVGAGLLFNANRADVVNDEIEPVETEESPGESDVVVTLEAFGDYQSAACAALHPALKKLKQEYGVDLNVIFRNLPMSTVNKNALMAAQTAEAARMQSRFWEMHDALFENQDQWKDADDPRPQFLKFARDLGLDVALFSRDFDGEQVRFRIQADKEAAVALGIQETPAILINGRRLKADAVTPEGIREGIDVMMSQSADLPPE